MSVNDVSIQFKDMASSNYEQVKKEAERLARSDNWGLAAISINNQLLELNDQDINAFTRLAKCFNLVGDKEKARDLYRQVLKIDPNNTIAKNGVNKLNAELFEIDQERKKEVVRQAEEKDLRDINSFEEALSLGKASKAQGNIRLAIKAFERAVELEPTNPYGLNSLGATYRHKGLLLQAEEIYQRVLEATPNNLVALVGLAAVKRDQGKPEAAIKLYSKVLHLNPNNPYALNGIAGVYADLENFEEAEDCFKQAVANPKCKQDAIDGLTRLRDSYNKNNDSESVERIDRWLKSLEMKANK